MHFIDDFIDECVDSLNVYDQFVEMNSVFCSNILSFLNRFNLNNSKHFYAISDTDLQWHFLVKLLNTYYLVALDNFVPLFFWSSEISIVIRYIFFLLRRMIIDIFGFWSKRHVFIGSTNCYRWS